MENIVGVTISKQTVCIFAIIQIAVDDNSLQGKELRDLL
jgi:hypothetical protein